MIGAELEQIWQRHLRYSYQEAHTVVFEPESVELLGVTQIDAGAFWVTTRLRVTLA